MPYETLSTLVPGRGYRKGVGSAYCSAMQLWREIWKDKRVKQDMRTLAAVLRDEYYLRFCWIGDGYGPEAMVVCGIVQFYHYPDGFGADVGKARDVAKALWDVNIDLHTTVIGVARLFSELRFRRPRP